jgi:hypothetical protein
MICIRGVIREKEMAANKLPGYCIYSNIFLNMIFNDGILEYKDSTSNI